jgi:hypothetical protein
LLIAIALKKLPEKYVTAFGTLNSSLGGAANLERFEEMCDSINCASSKKTNDDEEDELNLAAVGDKNNNNKNNNNNNHKNEDKCPHCGRTGLNPDKCWMLDKNASKRPDWFDPEKYCKKKTRGDGEIGAVGQGDYNGGPELLLSALSSLSELLQDPNIWIADMAATCDLTSYDMGAFNERKTIGDNGGVVFGDGKTNKTEKVFNLRAFFHDVSGKTKNIILANVHHVPLAAYNLFSLTKRLQSGWSLHGNEKGIWLAKSGQTVMLDIRIETPEGVVFAAHLPRKVSEQPVCNNCKDPSSKDKVQEEKSPSSKEQDQEEKSPFRND